MKRIAILGSTGSIGVNVLKVVSALEKEFEVVGLSANTNCGLLARQIRRFRPKVASVMSPEKAAGLKRLIKGRPTRMVSGLDGLIEVATHPGADIVVMAIVGSASLAPLLAAINAKKRIALASKEALVCAGGVVMAAARRNAVEIIPVDSEHSAIFQCLNGRDPSGLKKIYLTGSGGPLRNLPLRSFDALSPEQVIRHPKWKMGRKISVDSATLMNKGLEVIEAKWLFSTSLDKIEVLIHPEAIVHSMVEFIDGSILAQLGVPDMRLPIQHALTYPGRFMQRQELRLDFKKMGGLTFAQPDRGKFPCLDLAFSAAREGGTAPAALNASNEEAVRSFLDGDIKFTGIPKIIYKVLSRHKQVDSPALDDILETDRWAREEARKLCYQ